MRILAADGHVDFSFFCNEVTKADRTFLRAVLILFRMLQVLSDSGQVGGGEVS